MSHLSIQNFRVIAAATCYCDPLAIVRLVTCLRKQTVVVERLIVIDNSPEDCCDLVFEQLQPLCCDDGSCENLRQWLIWEHHPENVGLGAAMERSIEICDANAAPHFIWFFDQDSEPRPNSLQMILEHASELYEQGMLENVAILSSQTVHPGVGVGSNGMLNRLGVLVSVPRSVVLNGVPYFCDAVITGGMCVQFKALKASNVKVPSEYFLDMVDYEFCMRFRDAGYQVKVVPCSLVDHRMGEPKNVVLPVFGSVFVPNYSRQRWYYYTRNQTHFILTRGGIWLVSLGRSFLLLKTPIKEAIFSKSPFTFIAAACLGFCDGVRGRLGKRLLF